jgi:toxin ParE1/3/4
VRRNYEISRLAIKDLDDIWYFTMEHWSKQQANKYYKEIFEVIEELCSNPEIGKSIDEIKVGHMRINVKSHMIIYKINREIIYIDRILHQKMDLEKQIHI